MAVRHAGANAGRAVSRWPARRACGVCWAPGSYEADAPPRLPGRSRDRSGRTCRRAAPRPGRRQPPRRRWRTSDRRRRRRCTRRGSVRAVASVALACHVNPDGDTLGSMLGLHHVLLAHGVPSVASFSEPFVVAPHYRELPGLHLLTPPASFPREPDVMVTFDCGSLARLGDLEQPAKAARELIVIDHHISNEQYGTINLVDADAAASGVVVRALLHELGLVLNRDAAVCLYAALVCDTGRFQYESTTPAVFDLARELACFDVPIPSLSRTLFEEHRFAYLKLLSAVLQRAVLVPEQHFVWSVVTQDDLRRYDVTMEEVEGLIDIVRRTREAEVTALLKEESDGTVRVSLRSLGAVDVCVSPAGRGRRRSSLRRGLQQQRRHARRRRGPHVAGSLNCCAAGRLGVATMADGLVVVDKPAGCTSHDVVARCRKIFGQRSVGHAGTLDPDATGVLLVGLGRVDAPVALRAGGRQGVRRDRDSVSPPTRSTRRARSSHDRRCRSRSTRSGCCGAASSARSRRCRRWSRRIKVGGRRLHELAGGEEVERAARAVRIDRSTSSRSTRRASASSSCTSPAVTGTYVRSLAADLGSALGDARTLPRCAAPASARSPRRRPPARRGSRPSVAVVLDPRRDGARVPARHRRRANEHGPWRTVPPSPRTTCSAATTATARSRCSTGAASCSPSTSPVRGGREARGGRRGGRRRAPRCDPPRRGDRRDRGAVVTIGAYDGVHLGHRAVLPTCELADPRGLRTRSSPSTAIRPRSFVPSRRRGCSPTSTRSSSCWPRRVVDDTLVVHFDEARSKEPAEEFVPRGARRLRSAPRLSSSAPTSTSVTGAGNVTCSPAEGALRSASTCWARPHRGRRRAGRRSRAGPVHPGARPLLGAGESTAQPHARAAPRGPRHRRARRRRPAARLPTANVEVPTTSACPRTASTRLVPHADGSSARAAVARPAADLLRRPAVLAARGPPARLRPRAVRPARQSPLPWPACPGRCASTRPTTLVDQMHRDVDATRRVLGAP